MADMLTLLQFRVLGLWRLLGPWPKGHRSIRLDPSSLSAHWRRDLGLEN